MSITLKTLAIVSGLAFLSLPAVAQTADEFPGEQAAALDRDGDGKISIEEIDVFAETIYPGMDRNQDGKVDKSDLEGALTEEQFVAIDTDKDGNLSLEELRATMHADFAAADLDQSGQLN
ncbi:MAG: hypothetical protein DI533_10095 [Cereibacter sphaeroides]|uniref:EF-hand domain-containing protein n=1 Tax=Cereibacter sphaeroides TaxID=1063 RepID=A0A2W5SCP7_CERSP|nr:MAG: hypothetical protein DI533_10095 [Cereibacter sphaeroides]